MPHNRTRIWVGLAIVAVTIPAVAQYYYGSASHRSSNLTAEAAMSLRQDETAEDGATVAQNGRDYLGEVSSALAKGGSKPVADEPERSTVPIIFSGPVDAIMRQTQPADRQPSVAQEESAPAPVRLATRQAAVAEPDEEVADTDDSPAPAGLSDRTVYQLVVDNLPEDDRQTFVSAWAVMTPEERASLLDEWRANLNN